MLVGVCDFPSRYAFPPTGYGGIERWLWAVARLLTQVPPQTATLGLSRAVQQAYSFWSLVLPLKVPWPEVCRAIEHEVLGDLAD